MNSIKLSPESLHIVFSNFNFNLVNDKATSHLIACTYFVKKRHEISYGDFCKNIQSLGINKVYIIYIIDLTQDEINNNLQPYTNINREFWFEIQYITKKDFVYIITSSSFNFSETNKYCLYIFHEISWSEIIVMFHNDNTDVIVSGGSPSKRHILSPLQMRLSLYITSLFNMNSINASDNNNFKDVDKQKYLPYFDFSNKSKVIYNKDSIKKVYDLNLKTMSTTNLVTKQQKSSFHTYPRLNSINNRKSFLANCFIDLEKVISNKEKDNFAIQNDIEEYLFNNENNFKLLNKPENLTMSFSSATSKWILEKYDLIVDYLNNLKEKDITSKSKKVTLIQKNLLYTKTLLTVLGSKKVANILISFFLDLVSKETNEGRLIQMDCYTSLGKRLVNLYTYNLYSKYCKDTNSNITLTEWKSLNSNDFESYYDSPTLVAVAGNIIHFLTTNSINMIELTTEYGQDKKLHNIIKIEGEARRIMLKDTKDKIFSIPTKLPMIIEPKPYKYINGNIELGGYLKNNVFYTENLFIDKVGYRDTTKLKKNNDIIDLINGVSKVAYKINKEVLEYIQQFGIEKGIIISSEDSNLYSQEKDKLLQINKELTKFNINPYTKMSKKLNKQLRSVQSSVYLQTNILNIAELYSNISKIYFPVRLDQRTRLYCITEYLNYQSTDLSKSLLLFVKPGLIYKHNIDTINYLKSYGATLFDSALGRRSINIKSKWVDNNTDYIINFKSNDIINKAKDKACFLAFCFEYIRFVEFMNDINATCFNTYLPIQLDASCNGYQHLSLLTRDKKVLKQLNLTPSTKSDDPDDLYNYILIKIREFIKHKLSNSLWEDIEEKESLTRLDKIFLNRSIVKKALMTFSYNASISQMVDYIKEMLTSYSVDELNGINLDFNKTNKLNNIIKEKSNNTTEIVDNSKTLINIETDKCKKDNIVYVVNNNIENYITSKDIYKFIKYFKIVLNEEFPRMRLLNSYIRSIIKICTKLNIAIPWSLPSGAIISQSYLNSKTLKIRPFAFIKSSYNFRTIIKNEFDSVKQLNATMPNLIHSLDASSIALLYKVFSEYKQENIYTIHDCFAVTSNNVGLLIGILKGVYIKIYSENIYLSNLDKHIKNTIISIFGNNIFSDDFKFIYIGTNREEINYPSIDKVLDVNTNIDSLKDSEYIIK